MDGFQVFAWIVIGVIYLIYKSSNTDKTKKTGGNKPTPKTRPAAQKPATSSASAGSSANRNQELQDFLKALSKDLDKDNEDKHYRSLEEESINYDDPTTYRKMQKPRRNFAEIQEEQHEHAREIANERLSAAQKKRLGHAKSVSSLSEEQKKQLEHAKSVADSKKTKRPKIVSNASDVRKAFIMSEILKRKF